MQHHYVVMFDTDTNEFSIDYDSAEVRFVDGNVFDPETSSWQSGYFMEGDKDTVISDKLYALLKEAK